TKMLYYAVSVFFFPTPTGGIMFFRLSMCPILIKGISQEDLDGISSNLAQTVKGQNMFSPITQEFIH
ncbi:hypothetical protein P3447_27355, partial [Vibrio parahaemolyticus]|nr:hypothetical protein [Vibrio parahaemolyticus]